MIPPAFWEHGTIKPEALLELPGPFTVTEVALALRCSDEWLYKCIRAGAVKAGRIGRNYRIPASEARRLHFEANGSTATNSANGAA